jgi:hypothetical protein
MHSIAQFAFYGLALVSSIFAAPAPGIVRRNYPTQTVSDLLSTSFPALTDGSKILPLEQLALGTLPNGPLPPAGGISADGITSLQLIEINEFFEAAFFSSLLHNITNNVAGFEIADQEEKTFVIDTLIAIVAVSF